MFHDLGVLGASEVYQQGQAQGSQRQQIGKERGDHSSEGIGVQQKRAEASGPSDAIARGGSDWVGASCRGEAERAAAVLAETWAVQEHVAQPIVMHFA